MQFSAIEFIGALPDEDRNAQLNSLIQSLQYWYQDWSDHPVRSKYVPEYCVGEGAFASVFKATHIQTGRPVALKVLYKLKPGLQQRHVLILRREANYLRQLKHPNIVALKQIFENPRQLVLVLEYLQGGELLQHLHEIHSYTEASAARLFRQVVSGLQELHSNHLLHRDLKPENIVFVKPVNESQKLGEPLQIKLLDLGMACRYSESNQVRGILGSPGFVAPEIIEGGVHTPAMDVYALGVLLFLLLCGRYPMDTVQAQKLSYYSLEATEHPGMRDERWVATSDAAKDLITSLLARSAAQRPTCEDILQHTWVVTEGGEKPRNVGSDVAANARRAYARLRFRGVVQTVMLVNYAQSTIQRLRSASLESRRTSVSEDGRAVRLELHVNEARQRVGVVIEPASYLRLVTTSIAPSVPPHDVEESSVPHVVSLHEIEFMERECVAISQRGSEEALSTSPPALPMQELFEKWQAASRDSRYRREAADKQFAEQLAAVVVSSKTPQQPLHSTDQPDRADEQKRSRRQGDRFTAVVAMAKPASALLRRVVRVNPGSKTQPDWSLGSRQREGDDAIDELDISNVDTSARVLPERLMLANANCLIGKEELRELLWGDGGVQFREELLDSGSPRSDLGVSPFIQVTSYRLGEKSRRSRHVAGQQQHSWRYQKQRMSMPARVFNPADEPHSTPGVFYCSNQQRITA